MQVHDVLQVQGFTVRPPHTSAVPHVTCCTAGAAIAATTAATASSAAATATGALVAASAYAAAAASGMCGSCCQPEAAIWADHVPRWPWQALQQNAVQLLQVKK
jgi:hypothetical protein